MKKQMIAVLVAATMALAASGCGSSAASGSQDAGNTETSGAATAKNSGTEDHLARILAAGKITVATEGAWSPFTYHDETTNELVGFDVEVAKGIAERIGVEAVFEEVDFDGGLTGVSQGNFDMMANGVDVTEERGETYDFTDAYAYDQAVVVTLASNDSIASFEDLKGLQTANSVGSTYAAMGEEYGATVQNVPTLGETMELVLNGTVDATINANTSVQDYFNTTGNTELKVAAVDTEVTSYAVPLAKGSDNDSLREAINKAIAEMKEDGTLSEISVKYFGSDITQG